MARTEVPRQEIWKGVEAQVLQRGVSRLARVVCGVLVSPALCTGARAQDVVAVRIEYHAPAACPDVRAFIAQVSGRTARFRASDESPRAFVVELTVGDGARGRLTTIDGDARATRELDGDTCEEVVSALALVTALAIDPNASTLPVAAAPPPPVVTPASPPAPLPPILAKKPVRWHIDAGFGVEATGAVAPNDVLVGLGPFVEGSIDFGVFAPALRVSLRAAPAATSPVEGGGTARFGWWLVTTEACLRWGIVEFGRKTSGGGLGVAPCARLGAGILQADGGDVPEPRGEGRVWLDLGALVRLRWSPARIAFIEATGGAVFPLTRDRFRFEGPDTTVHRAAPVGALVGGDVGVHFP